MLKRILVILDTTGPGIQAQALAMRLAKKYKALVTGLGILDTPWMTAAQSEPLGGSAFKVHRDDMVIQHSQQQLKIICDDFSRRCQQSEIKSDIVMVEGFPAVEIEKLAQEYDLIVMGKTTDLHFDLDEDSDIIVKHVAKDNPRPLILVPEKPDNDDGDVMIAYDGSLQAARALHMFLLLGLGQGKHLHIVSGDKVVDKAAVIAKRAQVMCQSYGCATTVHAMAFEGSQTHQLLDILSSLRPALLVMGGFSHTLVRETLFGSCTKTLMKESPIPIFIHH